jgi:hypothetical protein
LQHHCDLAMEWGRPLPKTSQCPKVVMLNAQGKREGMGRVVRCVGEQLAPCDQVVRERREVGVRRQTCLRPRARVGQKAVAFCPPNNRYCYLEEVRSRPAPSPEPWFQACLLDHSVTNDS